MSSYFSSCQMLYISTTVDLVVYLGIAFVVVDDAVVVVIVVDVVVAVGGGV